MLADLEDDEAKDIARKFGKFTAEILLVVAAEKGIKKLKISKLKILDFLSLP